MLGNGATASRIHSVSDEVFTLAMKSSHYLVSASLRLEHCAICTLHDVLHTGAGSNLIRPDGLPICGWQNLVASANIYGLGNANGRLMKLLGVVVLRLRLGRFHLRVPFIY